MKRQKIWKKRAAGVLTACALSLFMAGQAMAEEPGVGPGYEETAEEPGQSPLGPGADQETNQAAGEEQVKENVFCTVRFSPSGLSLYAGMDAGAAPAAVLSEGTRVELLEGPIDSWAKVRVESSGQEGYVDFSCLRREDAIVAASANYTYEQMEKEIWALRDRYPGLLNVSIAGTTADGRNLYKLTMGEENPARTILIHAGIHAREYLNPGLTMEQLEMCLANYDNGTYGGKTYRELFSGTAVCLLPMVNPDGIAISQHGENGILTEQVKQLVQTSYAQDQADGKAESTYEKYLERWKANGRGVNLNRNFPNGHGQGVLSHPSSGLYGGETAGSEAETKLLMQLAADLKPSAVINYHSMGRVIYWDVPGNRYREKNQAFASMLGSLTGYRMMGTGNATGGYLDWLLVGENPVVTATLETGSAACPMPESEYQKVWKENLLVWPATAAFVLEH